MDSRLYAFVDCDCLALAMAEQAPKKLTAEQKEKAKAWIESHCKGGCPVCGHQAWNLSDDFVEIRPHYETAFLGGVVYPAVLITCANCHYIMLFHALLIGAMEMPEPERKKDAN